MINLVSEKACNGMIGLLIYLTARKPNIMFIMPLCQVTKCSCRVISNRCQKDF